MPSQMTKSYRDQFTAGQTPSTCPASVQVRTRLKRRKNVDSSESEAVITLDLQTLEPYFNMPLSVAVEKIGLRPTALKSACRKLGISEWPFKRGTNSKKAYNPTRFSFSNQDTFSPCSSSASTVCCAERDPIDQCGMSDRFCQASVQEFSNPSSGLQEILLNSNNSAVNEFLNLLDGFDNAIENRRGSEHKLFRGLSFSQNKDTNCYDYTVEKRRGSEYKLFRGLSFTQNKDMDSNFAQFGTCGDLNEIEVSPPCFPSGVQPANINAESFRRPSWLGQFESVSSSTEPPSAHTSKPWDWEAPRSCPDPMDMSEGLEPKPFPVTADPAWTADASSASPAMMRTPYEEIHRLQALVADLSRDRQDLLTQLLETQGALERERRLRRAC